VPTASVYEYSLICYEFLSWGGCNNVRLKLGCVIGRILLNNSNSNDSQIQWFSRYSDIYKVACL